MDAWDPQKEHFDSIRNAYNFNENSYEAHNFGYGSLNRRQPNYYFSGLNENLFRNKISR